MISVESLETAGLGNRSYLATDGRDAVVVDAQRDIDRLLALVDARGVRVTHVLETHVHNDYVTGGHELARVTGASYVLPAGSGAAFEHLPAADGDVIAAGTMRVRALRTPGHTHHHTSYALSGDDGAAAGDGGDGAGDGGDGAGDGGPGAVRAVFTGGSMLYGAAGRTDLAGPEHTEALTRAQYRSVRRLAAELPAAAEVYPTHGFGSFCSATPTSGTSSTVGEQAGVNPALVLDEADFVETLLAGLGAYPGYYARMAPINRLGPPPLDLSPPAPVDAAELRARIARGEWVVDLRDRAAYAAAHLAGTRAFELSRNFVTYVGWLHAEAGQGAPVTLVGESHEQIARARRELARIGVDDLAGAAVGDVADLAGGQPLRSYDRADFADLAAARARRPLTVLDTRRDDEHAAGHVAGALHIPLHELERRLDEVPGGEVWVHCRSGYRAAVAASMLEGPGRDVVLVDDDYENAAAAGLERRPG